MAGRMQDPKRCPVCDTYKPRSEFYPRRKIPNAVMSSCKECTKSAHKDWYVDNREYDIATSAKWREDNRELYQEQMRKWKQANPERKKELEHRRRTRKQDNGVYFISAKDMRKLTGPCAYCGSLDNITMDHVIPISRGGTHGIGNLVPACHQCNTVKNARTVMEWRMSKSSHKARF